MICGSCNHSYSERESAQMHAHNGQMICNECIVKVREQEKKIWNPTSSENGTHITSHCMQSYGQFLS